MAGQRCTANRRAIVHVHEFMQLLLEESTALQWGDPLQDKTDIGPLVSMPHRDRVAAAVERAATAWGAPLLPFGDAPATVGEHAGKFYPSTILCFNEPTSEIVQEETLGLCWWCKRRKIGMAQCNCTTA